jgi:hypothetical protein
MVYIFLAPDGSNSMSGDYGTFTSYNHDSYYYTYSSNLLITVPINYRVNLTFDYFQVSMGL